MHDTKRQENRALNLDVIYQHKNTPWWTRNYWFSLKMELCI